MIDYHKSAPNFLFTEERCVWEPLKVFEKFHDSSFTYYYKIHGVHVEWEENFWELVIYSLDFEGLDSDHADMASTFLSLLAEPLC